MSRHGACVGGVVGRPRRLATETLVEFVAREGVVSTASVATRFGWSMQRAWRELEALRDVGVVDKRPRRMNDWHLTEFAEAH